MKGKRLLALLLALSMLFPLLGQAEDAAEETFVLEREPGTRQLTLYWKHPATDYSRCDVWMWFPGKDGSGQLFHPCDYGVKCVVNVPEEIKEVGFIVRRDCSNPGGSTWGEATKDFGDDRFAILTGDTTEIYLQPGDGMQYTSPDGGATLVPIRLFTMAGILSPREIRYNITPAARLTAQQVHVRQNGREVPVEKLSSEGNNVITGIITVAEDLDIALPYTVEIEEYGQVAAIPTEIFDSPAFIDAYTYDGDDLGAVIREGKTVFKVWAPTASAVALNLYEAGDGGEAAAVLPMAPCGRGVWTAEADCGHGTYYTYSVTTALGTQEAVDPYARSLGVNGDRGMVVDLPSTDPEGFRESRFYAGIDSYRDAVIWEVHVRDFSNALASSRYPGKYLAFTETGLTNASGEAAGLDYVKQLGITHVHLQPVYDFATVDETGAGARFNWGYDPKNYNAPEGSYATDPYHGEVRVREFKQMVQSLHENGLGVVMDVVYNHTYALDSCLNRVVPYYYYRFAYDSSPSNGSGCGNETASDRVMFRKYMVDSVRYWAEEYKVDGFRFDLMALHDVTTMQAVEEAVHGVNPRAIIYGEGWTGGTSALRESFQARQANIRQVKPTGGAIGAIAVFNDAIRDGLKGSVFDAADQGYANGKPTKANANKVIFGILGGQRGNGASWFVDDAMVINYTSSHDNHTLWDKLQAANGSASRAVQLDMVRLCAATVLLSRGTPFFLAGEEMLRSKGGDSNSYASSDAVNNLNWDALTPGSDEAAMAAFYAGLIRLRRQDPRFAFLRTALPEAQLLDGSVIAVTWRDGERTVGYAVINPNPGSLTLDPPEGMGAYCIGVQGADILPAERTEGAITVAPRSVTLIAPAE